MTESTVRPPLRPARMAHIDGLRGAAILLVILFHAYARWPQLVPFGAAYAAFPLARYGFLGVQLFFMISGFVIFMTLERTDLLREFIVKRWLRLFPAMLVCSALVFATAGFFSERPSGTPHLIDLLPGLLFVEPLWLSGLLGRDVQPLEGGFWTLFVEVKFYLVFGVAYYLAGRRAALAALAVLSAAGWAATLMDALLPAGAPAGLATLVDALGARHFGWFLAGALVYAHSRHRSRTSLALGIVTVLLAAALLQRGFGAVLSGLVLGGGFVAAMATGAGRRFLSAPTLVFMGGVSYPLYLLHENMMISLMLKLHAAAPQIPGVLLPVLPVAALTALAWPIAHLAEPRLRGLISQATASRDRRSAAA